MSQNLFDQFVACIDDGDKVAIRTLGGELYSYKDIVDLSGRLANALIALGLEPGDRVAVQIEKSVPALVLYLAVVRAGAVYLPLNTAYTFAELEYFVGDAEPKVIVCDPAKQLGLEKVAAVYGASLATLDSNGQGSLMEQAMQASPEFQTVPRETDDLAAILYTSGTTGRSKGAMMTHGNLASNAFVLKDYWRFGDKDVLLHALPIYHTHGLFVATNCVLFSNASMLFLPRFDPEAVFRMLPNATCFMGVPTFYTRLLQDPRLNVDATKHMRLFISGSAPLLAETHREWEERTSHPILERYGMTETGMNTSNPYDGSRVPGTVGFPLPGVELRVIDQKTGEEALRSDVGMIEVRGPNVFNGYWRMPEKTSEELRPDGFFITGDLGKIDESGYVHIVGRGKDLVITGGFNVYPKEVESEIDEIPGVIESAVIGLPHPDFGEGVTAIVVLDRGASVSEAEVTATLSGRLAKFKIPKQVILVNELPRNSMGKVQKNVLRDTYSKLYKG